MSASGLAQKGKGPDITASRTLEEFGFEPAPGKTRNNMNEGAVPKLPLVARYDSTGVKFFKLIQVGKKGARANLIQLEVGKVFDDSTRNNDTITLLAHGGKLLDWEIIIEDRALDESALNTHGEIRYDNHVRKTSKPREKRVRPLVTSSASHVRPSIPAVVAPVAAASQASPPPFRPTSTWPETNEVESPPATVRIEKPATSLAPIPPIPVPTLHASNGNGNGHVETPTRTTPAPSEKVREYVDKLLIEEIMPDPEQPREYFDQAELLSMASSMKEESQVVLVIVRPIPEENGKRYMLIDGERRWRSMQLAGIKEVLVIVRPGTDNKKAFRQSVIANFNRCPHTVGENVKVIKRLLADGATVTEVCRLCGKSAAWYYKHIAFEKLHPDLLKLIDPPTEKKFRLPGDLARKLAYIPLVDQLAAYNKVMQEPSAKARNELAYELAKPYMAESRRNKPSDHARTLERFVLSLRGANKRNFQNAEVAVKALLGTRKPDQVKAFFETISESIKQLTDLKQLSERLTKEVAH